MTKESGFTLSPPGRQSRLHPFRIQSRTSQAFSPGSLLGIEQLSESQILKLLEKARRFEKSTPGALLRGKKVALLFYEPSTRTRVSFEFAAKSLGAATTVVTSSGSSIEKGESLVDTGLTLQALGAGAIVIRHPASGAPHVLARRLSIPVINAGDGVHEHPSQALVDAYTILKEKKTIRNLRVAIIGDILHSRVARSNMHLLGKLGAHIRLCGPPTLLPGNDLLPGNLKDLPRITTAATIEGAVRGADVVILLRVQKERLGELHLNAAEYVSSYQLTPERLLYAKPDVILMHPGPAIRGMELSGQAAESPRSRILDQVRHGIPVRMAILASALEKTS